MCIQPLGSDKCIPKCDIDNVVNNLDKLHESCENYGVLLKCLEFGWIVSVHVFDSNQIYTTVINEDLIPLWNVDIDIKNRKWFYDGRNLDDIFYQDRILPIVCYKDTGMATGICNRLPIDAAHEIAAEFGYSGPLGMLEWLKEINYPTFRQLEQITGKTFFTAQKKEK